MTNKYLKLENYKTKLRDIFGKKYNISYSQNGEDIIIQTLSKLLDINKPTYIDIGAFHPKNLNNTYIFYKNGSYGINIEPNIDAFNRFLNIRPKDINLNIGVGEKEDTLNYFVMNLPTLNSFSKKEVDEYTKNKIGTIIENRKIKVKTISEILRENNEGKFPDILSLDTEGMDFYILKSINWALSTPKIICVETITPTENKNREIISYLEEKNYTIHADTYINTIFVRNDVWKKHIEK